MKISLGENLDYFLLRKLVSDMCKNNRIEFFLVRSNLFD